STLVATCCRPFNSLQCWLLFYCLSKPFYCPSTSFTVMKISTSIVLFTAVVTSAFTVAVSAIPYYSTESCHKPPSTSSKNLARWSLVTRGSWFDSVNGVDTELLEKIANNEEEFEMWSQLSKAYIQGLPRDQLRGVLPLDDEKLNYWWSMLDELQKIYTEHPHSVVGDWLAKPETLKLMFAKNDPKMAINDVTYKPAGIQDSITKHYHEVPPEMSTNTNAAGSSSEAGNGVGQR
ncbi:hypothetical protein BC835DRAFT_1477452, partial [Cytidiella melzeri]